MAWAVEVVPDGVFEDVLFMFLLYDKHKRTRAGLNAARLSVWDYVAGEVK